MYEKCERKYEKNENTTKSANEMSRKNENNTIYANENTRKTKFNKKCERIYDK